MRTYTGGCACGAVRFEAVGEPLRTGLCHCMTCRKHHGSAFNPFAVFRAEDVLIAGTLRPWSSSDHATRSSCEICSSPICQREDDGSEIELHLGSFDEPSVFAPAYENWVPHREAWLPQLGLPQRQTDMGHERRHRLDQLDDKGSSSSSIQAGA